MPLVDFSSVDFDVDRLDGVDAFVRRRPTSTVPCRRCLESERSDPERRGGGRSLSFLAELPFRLSVL